MEKPDDTNVDFKRGAPPGPLAGLPPRRYSRLLWRVVLSTATVALLPLLIMTGINYYQVQRLVRSEARQPIDRQTTSSRRAVEFFLQERESALRLVVHNESIRFHCTNDQLLRILRNLRKSMTIGSFVDLGVVGTDGRQKCYAGPYKLLNKQYQKQDWFHHIWQRGVYISDVFLGYRHSPHFVIAIRHEDSSGKEFILRATVDAEQLTEQLLTAGLSPTSDAFIVNRKGVLQSPSRRYGQVLSRVPINLPGPSDRVEVANMADEKGRSIYVGSAYVRNSPFIVLLVIRHNEAMGGFGALRMEIVGFLAVSCILVLLVIFLASRSLVQNIRRADVARAGVFHKMEYTNKLASVGRLAAGVAHEINNPLAIINEKAGLLKDRYVLSTAEHPPKERVLRDVDSILQSVDRCSAITHRLLGFARHMDVRRERIDLAELIEQVLGFLDKEAAHRDLLIASTVEKDLPPIKSDRGQLQQVFLNIINNAFAAVEDKGRIEIDLRRSGEQAVAVRIADNGVGIRSEDVERIFEPFFTTRMGEGTGLGLSVTYGIVQKLGGKVSVQSEFGEGTTFIVELPLDASG